MDTYERLKAEVQKLIKGGLLLPFPTREQQIDWALGQTRLSNPSVTRQMVEDALTEEEKADLSR